MRKRRRRQKGSLKKVGNSWVAKFWEAGTRRTKTLGKVSRMSKTQAENELEEILTPINRGKATPSQRITFGEFVMQVQLPFYRRKWKDSTRGTNEARFRFHLIAEFSKRSLTSFTRDDLQDFLDRKAAAGLSHSTVAHLRWDLRQIFKMAVAEGYLDRNPAELLFTPRDSHRPTKRQMTMHEIRLLFSVLNLRELLIVMLAVIGGMRPGEILALKWEHVKWDHLDIRQRVYRGKIDTPKTHLSVRKVALSARLRSVLEKWKTFCIDTNPDAWVFPSENRRAPLLKDNCWRRHVAPHLKVVRLGWVTFHVMRRTHASLMRELEVDPKVVADQLGHSLDVNLNVYTETNMDRRAQAVNELERALGIS